MSIPLDAIKLFPFLNERCDLPCHVFGKLEGDEESGHGCWGLTVVAFTKVFKGQCFENKNILDRVGHKLQNANGEGCFVMIRKESY